MLKVIRNSLLRKEHFALVDYTADGVIVDDSGEVLSSCIIGYDCFETSEGSRCYDMIPVYLFIKGEYSETINLDNTGDYEVETERFYAPEVKNNGGAV